MFARGGLSTVRVFDAQPKRFAAKAALRIIEEQLVALFIQLRAYCEVIESPLGLG